VAVEDQNQKESIYKILVTADPQKKSNNLEIITPLPPGGRRDTMLNKKQTRVVTTNQHTAEPPLKRGDTRNVADAERVSIVRKRAVLNFISRNRLRGIHALKPIETIKHGWDSSRQKVQGDSLDSFACTKRRIISRMTF
jgi:hypothetical protein